MVKLSQKEKRKKKKKKKLSGKRDKYWVIVTSFQKMLLEIWVSLFLTRK